MNLKHVVYGCLLSLASFTAYAADYALAKAYPPYIIKKQPFYMSHSPSGMSSQHIKTAYTLDQEVAQGKGQIIAIIDAFDHPSVESDLGVFNTTFNLPACTTANGCFKKIYASGTQPPTNTNWAVEVALDVEWAHAIAPQAAIYLIEANSALLTDLFQAITVAINSGADVISMSWGGSEHANQTQYDNIFKASTAAFVAASGDSSHIIFPSSSPYVISVGGTTLKIDANGNRLSETAWSGSGGGLSTVESVPDYQQNYPIPNNPGLMRGTPDVSYNADPNTGVSVYVTDAASNGWLVIGGTSIGAPQWAGIIALTNSILRTRIPDVGALLYKVANRKYNMTYFDITSGTNGTCGYYCTAGLNYDYVTGLGSPHALYLVNMMIRGGNLAK